jgi:hypothetical protein
MQNYIDVKKLSANVIAKNPCLQENEQEKAVDAILAENSIVYNVQYLGEFIDDNWKYDKWTVTFAGKDGNKQEFKYHTGLWHRQCVKPRPFGWGNYSAVQRKSWVHENERPVSPFAGAVLYCLLLDMSLAHDTFEEWCSSLGYDTDSRKALQTYLSCQENGTKLRKVFSNDLLKRLEKALEDY